MENSLDLRSYDLVSPDGKITAINYRDSQTAEVIVSIENISPLFVGFEIDPTLVFFNLKSTLAQIGLEGKGLEYELDRQKGRAQIKVLLIALGLIASEMLGLLTEGAYIGRLFAADERRRVRDPEYLSRIFGRADRWGEPLLSLGGLHGSSELVLEKVDGRTLAFLTLQSGCITYDSSIHGFLPTLAKSLVSQMKMRNVLSLHQQWHSDMPRITEKGQILLVKTQPLHVRTVFARVVDSELPQGYHHTTASILQPDTAASGDIYELYGSSQKEITDIPLEFYTLEPYREHVFFQDRDQLQVCLENSSCLFKAFETAPKHPSQAAVFVVKGTQMLNLSPENWIAREPRLHDFPGFSHGERQALMVERYIKQQPSYPFLKAIDDNYITSQGILLTRYFPSPLMKRMLLGDQVQRHLKGIYFQKPSDSFGNFFSSEDRALLHDLNKFAIPVFWVDEVSGKILQYVQKPDRDSGLFVPLQKVDTFLKSTVFGIYGSNLLGSFEEELHKLLKGLLLLRDTADHPLLHKKTPLSLVTGGGPGAMEVGNKVAIDLGILSCANIVDFRQKDSSVINEQLQNPYVEAKMTYRIDKLVERQAEFHLDFPIFLTGGVGTDFEFCLEEVRRKVGAIAPNPIILFGSAEYWKEKITSRFQCNLKSNVIKGSEWLSNCFYVAQTAEEALEIYKRFFQNTLPIGKNGPVYKDGFASFKDLP